MVHATNKVFLWNAWNMATRLVKKIKDWKEILQRLDQTVRKPKEGSLSLWGLKEYNMINAYIICASLEITWLRSLLKKKRDRNWHPFGRYCHFVSLFLTSVLILASLFRLMLLYVVTPCRVIRHHCHLISHGNPSCLLIPSISSLLSCPSTFSIFPWSLLSLFGLPDVHLRANIPQI